MCDGFSGSDDWVVHSATCSLALIVGLSEGLCAAIETKAAGRLSRIAFLGALFCTRHVITKLEWYIRVSRQGRVHRTPCSLCVGIGWTLISQSEGQCSAITAVEGRAGCNDIRLTSFLCETDMVHLAFEPD